MSDADIKLENAIQSIRSAIKDLSGIVIDECDGDLDFTKEFRITMLKCLNELIVMRSQLSDES